MLIKLPLKVLRKDILKHFLLFKQSKTAQRHFSGLLSMSNRTSAKIYRMSAEIYSVMVLQ